MWTHGYARSGPGFISEPYITAKQGAVLAAGGLSAAATLYGLLSIIATYCSYNNDKSLLSATVSGLRNGVSPFASVLAANNLSYEKKRFLLNACFIACTSIIFNVFYGCTPWIGEGDGIRLWRDIMGVSDNKLLIARGISTVGAVGSYVWLFKKFYAARATLSAQYKIQLETQDEQVIQPLTEVDI